MFVLGGREHIPLRVGGSVHGYSLLGAEYAGAGVVKYHTGFPYGVIARAKVTQVNTFTVFLQKWAPLLMHCSGSRKVGSFC